MRVARLMDTLECFHQGEFKMNESEFMPDETLIAHAVDILVENLGAVEASRFLNLPRKKRTESVERHRLWQAQLDKDQFFNKMFND